MAKAITLVDRKATALTDKEKAEIKAVKNMLAMLRSGDASGWTTYVETVNRFDRVFRQDGEGDGKRISGAKSHEFADQVAAFADVVIRGNLPKIA